MNDGEFACVCSCAALVANTRSLAAIDTLIMKRASGSSDGNSSPWVFSCTVPVINGLGACVTLTSQPSWP